MSHHCLLILNGLHRFLKKFPSLRAQLVRWLKPDMSAISELFQQQNRLNLLFTAFTLVVESVTMEKILNNISANREMVKAGQWWIKLTYLDNRVLFEIEIELTFTTPKPTNSNCFPVEILFKTSLTKKVIYLQEIYYRVKKPVSFFAFVCN